MSDAEALDQLASLFWTSAWYGEVPGEVIRATGRTIRHDDTLVEVFGELPNPKQFRAEAEHHQKLSLHHWS